MNVNHKLYLTSLRNAENHLVSQIRGSKQDDPLKDITILLPSTAALKYFRTKLNNTAAIYFLQFYSLADAILDEAADPVTLVKDTTIRQIISKILSEMNHQGILTSFAAVHEKPGFVTVLLQWLREMKSQGIHPDDYQAFAADKTSTRDTQLTQFYQMYQDYLHEHGFADPDGRLWLAAEALEKDSNLFTRNGPLFILGHDQFTPIQLNILKCLVERFDEMSIYLHWSDQKSDDDLALTRLCETRDTLLKNLSLQTISLPDLSQPRATLSHLAGHLFELSPKTIKAEQNLQLIESPSREVEVSVALRMAKRLLLEGIAPETIGILVPNPKAYLPILHTMGEAYSLPLECDLQLSVEPMVQDLINLISMAPDFPWGSTFQALRSPYIQQFWLSPEQIDQLDQLSREQPVLEGREQWVAALQPIQEAFPDFEDEDLGHPPFISTLSEEEIQHLRNGIKAFFDALTPPEEATVQNYAWWVQTNLLGVYPGQNDVDEIVTIPNDQLPLIKSLYGSSKSEHDIDILGIVLECLQELLDAYYQVDTHQVIPWETFRLELISIIKSKRIDPGPLHPKIVIGPLAAGRERLFDHLFILGLSEGEFPARPEGDVFYALKEREDFSLPIRRYVSGYDASLFWQVVSNANSTLTLLRPYLDDNGAQWQPSPYWGAIKICFDKIKVTNIPIADRIDINNAACPSELLVACAQAHARIVPNALQSRYAYAQSAEFIHAQRNSYQPPGVFEGVLQSEDLLTEIRDYYYPEVIWSASRLNTYGNCPFNFFADNLLKLKSRLMPEDGLNPMQRGILLHTLLERTMNKLQDQGIRLAQENMDNVVAALDASCEEVFPSAHLRYGFQPTPLWTYEQQELHRMLKVYLTWECIENKGRFFPYRQETKFGIQGIEPKAYLVETDAGGFYIRGVIDRIDKDDHGNLNVIDYKSGTTKFSKENIEEGLALQTALYALVADRYWADENEKVSQSEYRHLPDQSTSGKISFKDHVAEHETVQKAVKKTSLNIQRIREGVFPSATEKSIRGPYSCTTYCDYAPLCRVSRQSISKSKEAGLK